MSGNQQAVLVAGILGACFLAFGLLFHGPALRLPDSEPRTLSSPDAGLHDELVRLENITPAERTHDEGLWKAYLQRVDQELERRRVSAAVRVWHDAYGAALGSRSWESMIAVGDAFIRIGQIAGAPVGARANARQAYLAALIRARRDRSVDGVLRTAEAFQELGDRAVVEQCLRVATQVAGNDERAQQRVGNGLRRWMAQTTVAEF